MTKPFYIIGPGGHRTNINSPLYYMPKTKKQVPKKPAEGECDCAYEAYCLELNVDSKYLSASDYALVEKLCPVHGKKSK